MFRKIAGPAEIVHAFEATSSTSGEIYDVIFTKSGEKLSLTCTCKAGVRNSVLCKHRIAVIEGNTLGLSGGDFEKLSEIVGYIQDSRLPQRMAELEMLEAEAKALKQRIADKKRDCVAVLDGQ